MSVFDLYDKIKPLIDKNQHKLFQLIKAEYIEIQHNKTTSLNKNYMFNDAISNPFYDTIGITKENFKGLISNYVKSTKNFDSLDANNILLQFIMRFTIKTNQNSLLLMTYEIFLYKNFYPIFNTYFKYGVDETAFEYFKTTLSSKFEISKQENLYAAVDSIGKRNLEKYKSYISGNNEKEFLLLPVNTKTRLNQFVKELMRSYAIFLEKNKIHLNASRDLEDEENGSFNDQITNNNKSILEYRNKLSLSLINNEIPDQILKNLSLTCKKISFDSIQKIYKYLIKSSECREKLISLFVENLDHKYTLDDSKLISPWMEEIIKFKPKEFVIELDEMFFNKFPEYKNTLLTSELVEIRKIVIFMLYLFLKRSN